MPSTTLTMTGDVAVTNRLTALGVSMFENLAPALYQEAQDVAETCRATVPVRTGTLKNTIRTTMPVKMPDGSTEVRIIAGGAAAPYAVVVHENLEAHHNNGSAKYIQTPLRNALSGMSERIAARMSRNNQQPGS